MPDEGEVQYASALGAYAPYLVIKVSAAALGGWICLDTGPVTAFCCFLKKDFSFGVFTEYVPVSPSLQLSLSAIVRPHITALQSFTSVRTFTPHVYTRALLC